MKRVKLPYIKLGLNVTTQELMEKLFVFLTDKYLKSKNLFALLMRFETKT